MDRLKLGVSDCAVSQCSEVLPVGETDEIVNCRWDSFVVWGDVRRPVG